MRRRLLHAIHDFLPRHRAGSEIYAFGLARELSRRHDVFVLTAEYDPAVPHGTLRWRMYEGLTVIELVNNWEFDSFEESYRSPRINAQLRHVLAATCPDVLHVHNLLNLSFDLPRLARERGIRSVATLHDYTLACASGGQRVHAAEAHVCRDIDVSRCSRCFAQSPFAAQMNAGRFTRYRGVARLGALAGRRLQLLAGRVAGTVLDPSAGAGDMSMRLAYARHVFETIDLFVAPSRALGDEFVRLGVDPARVAVSDYGFTVPPRLHHRAHHRPLSIGFVGTLVWHKGVHILLAATRMLTGQFNVRVFGDPAVFPDYSAELRALAAGLPVQFMGPFEERGVEAAYESIDVLVVPSIWPENSPLVIHEAFMRGVPVVGSEEGGIPELVTHGVNGFTYRSNSPLELASALQRLVDDPGLASRLASHAPAVKSIEDDAREWESRYATLLSNENVAVEALGP